MKKTETPQLSQLIIILQNINDKLYRIDEHLIEIGNKTQKHVVVIKKENKSSIKEQK